MMDSLVTKATYLLLRMFLSSYLIHLLALYSAGVSTSWQLLDWSSARLHSASTWSSGKSSELWKVSGGRALQAGVTGHITTCDFKPWSFDLRFGSGVSFYRCWVGMPVFQFWQCWNKWKLDEEAGLKHEPYRVQANFLLSLWRVVPSLL
jgi:hypothetical protein